MRRPACNSRWVLHSSAVIGSRPHIWTQNQTPGKYERPFRSSRGISALGRTNRALQCGRPLFENKDGLLRGEVLNPATEPATKVSAICRRASRPVGLFPFLCWSWMRLSNSSLKAWRRRGERKTETKHERTLPSPELAVSVKQTRHLRTLVDGRRAEPSRVFRWSLQGNILRWSERKRR